MSALSFIQGAGFGAGIMYFFDPDLGHRRRALLRDQVVHLMHEVNHGAESSLDDFSHRLEGAAAEARSMTEQRPVDDTVLVERVRSRIGRINSHPGAIFVTSNHGVVTLSGPVLRDEVSRLLAGVRSVPGVRDVVDHVQVHDTPGDVPGLQGESHLAGTHAFLDASWNPSARLMAGTMGAGLIGYGLGKRDLFGWMAGIGGLALLGRAVSNQTWQQLVGIDAGRDAVTYPKEINVDAPIDQVFNMWSNVENFPRFMEHVLEAHVTGPGQTSWTIRGPFGLPIRFESETTIYNPTEEIAWKSVDGSTVPNEGRVQFRTNPDGSTRINVHLSYTPPVGIFGNVLASFMGDDPRELLNDDLMRFKTLLENGRTTIRHQTVELSQLSPRPAVAHEAMETSSSATESPRPTAPLSQGSAPRTMARGSKETPSSAAESSNTESPNTESSKPSAP